MEAQDDITPQSDTVSTESLLNTGNSETGAVLREINGVNASRKGGHGLDPQIRGQQYSQLNVLLMVPKSPAAARTEWTRHPLTPKSRPMTKSKSSAA